MAPTENNVLKEAAERLFAEMAKDADILAGQLTNGDLHADTADVPDADYKEIRFMDWADPEKRTTWARSVEPEVWLDEAFDIIAPSASKHVRTRFKEMLESGVEATEAVKIAQQIHDAEQLRYDVMHPDLDAPPPILAAMQFMGGQPAAPGGMPVAPSPVPPLPPPPPFPVPPQPPEMMAGQPAAPEPMSFTPPGGMI